MPSYKAQAEELKLKLQEAEKELEELRKVKSLLKDKKRRKERKLNFPDMREFLVKCYKNSNDPSEKAKLKEWIEKV